MVLWWKHHPMLKLFVVNFAFGRWKMYVCFSVFMWLLLSLKCHSIFAGKNCQARGRTFQSNRYFLYFLFCLWPLVYRYRHQPDALTVIVGQTDPSNLETEQIIPVFSIQIHENYDHSRRSNDVAMLQVSIAKSRINWKTIWITNGKFEISKKAFGGHSSRKLRHGNYCRLSWFK